MYLTPPNHTLLHNNNTQRCRAFCFLSQRICLLKPGLEPITLQRKSFVLPTELYGWLKGKTRKRKENNDLECAAKSKFQVVFFFSFKYH